MPFVWTLLTILSAVGWFGWYFLTSLGCGYSNGQICGPFQGDPAFTFVTVWAPMGCIAVLFGTVWLLTR